jgi:hypothetical protein
MPFFEIEKWFEVIIECFRKLLNNRLNEIALTMAIVYEASIFKWHDNHSSIRVIDFLFLG